jgi:TRAP-type uncharacterized transport system fused permease subunit
MAYRPLLGNGPAEMVAFTMVITAIGLIAFTSSLERFLLRDLNIFETILMGGASLAMFWPIVWLNILGLLLFLSMLGIQWVQKRRLAMEEVPA